MRAVVAERVPPPGVRFFFTITYRLFTPFDHQQRRASHDHSIAASVDCRRRASPRQGTRLSAKSTVAETNVGSTLTTKHWQRLDQFLSRGVAGGTYYIGERELSIDAQAVIDCLAEDGLRVIQRVLEVGESDQGSTNDPALFVLAIAASCGDDATWAASLAALPRIARSGTHLARWLEYVNERTAVHGRDEAGRSA